LCTIAVQRNVDGIISTMSEELIVLGQHEQLFSSAGIATWFPPADAVRWCVDKWEFAQRLHDANVPTPATALGTRDGVPGPWVVKPRCGRGSQDVFISDDPNFVDLIIGAVPDAIVQQKAAGAEFTADCLVDRSGTVRAVCPRWRSLTRGGISVKGTTFSLQAINDAVIGTVNALGLNGPLNLQGFVDTNGSVTVIEVNPRFSGALPLTLAAGAEIVTQYVAAMFGEELDDARLAARDGVTMYRRFSEFYTENALLEPPAVHPPFTSSLIDRDVTATTGS
jgi:carbamoyl-phosphate synthase large subunit